MRRATHAGAAFAPLAFLAALLGCAAFPAYDRIDVAEMAPRLAYQGFSFDRPPDPRWYLLQSEESHTSVTLRRDLGDASATHTFYAVVSLGGIERQPATHEEFAALARSEQQAPYRIQELAYHQALATRQGQWCVRIESTHAVLGAPVAPDRELTMILRGYRCLHPTWPKTTLDFFYSERGVASELDPALAAEGEAFLRGVRIDVAPDTPAGASAP